MVSFYFNIKNTFAINIIKNLLYLFLFECQFYYFIISTLNKKKIFKCFFLISFIFLKKKKKKNINLVIKLNF
jgi:hypothetical protein